MKGCGKSLADLAEHQDGRAQCGACLVERYITKRILEDGCDPKLYDLPEVIASRLAAAGVTIADVRAAVYLGQPLSSAVFWRAVYGPAYPAAVMADA